MVSRAFGKSFGIIFFSQTANLNTRITTVGSDHPFDERIGRLGRKGVLGNNMGLRA